MPVKLKYGSNPRSNSRSGFGSSLLRGLLLVTLGCLVIGVAIFGYLYFHYQHVVDNRLAAGSLLSNSTQIYAAPREIRPGQKLTSDAIAADLRHANYNSDPQMGTFKLNGDSIFIKPGPESYHSTDGATITTSGGVVQKITAENGVALAAYDLEPQLITALSEDKSRTKRRLVTYNEIPRQMVQAVTAIEDRKFFEHGGLNYVSMIGWIWHDIVGDRKVRGGGSTLTMQLAKLFFVEPRRANKFEFIKYKSVQILVAFQLEARFSKQQIFEIYVNEINLGQRGSYAINGIGEAAQTYFGKNLRQLNTTECALIAGIIQSPSRLNPYRHPERATARRNIVLDSMVETGAITASEATRFKAEPLHLAPPNLDAREAPYFVDLVHDQLVRKIGDQDLGRQSLRIYTSLDPDLQHAAAEAVEVGMKNVDELVRKRYKKGATNITYPQVSLVAINPHSGQVLALVGGRNYTASQLNHAVAKRPTGSIFKPFVYASAYNTSLNGLSLGGNGVFTATTILNDVPTTFTYDNGRQTYTARNYMDEYHGNVTAIYALAHSLNNATISLGQQVGFDNIAALARASGITAARGTPSVALGSYDATPLDMAGAYTVFANNGVHLDPWLLASVRNANGDIVADFAPQARQVMDPRAAFLTQSLLEGVMNFGYGYAVRQRGFTAPAAGKTGTSHDAWFAAYTSNLICIVWIGNDDYTDVKLSGAVAAAPIWAEFMNRAIKLPQYSDVKPFSPPDGVTEARLDKTTNLLADATCPNDYTAAFLDGTAPQNFCSQMGESPQNFVQRLFGIGGSKPNVQPNTQPESRPGHQPDYQPVPATNPQAPHRPNTAPVHSNTPPEGNAPEATPPAQPKKRNFFQKLLGIGGNDDDNKQQQSTPPE